MQIQVIVGYGEYIAFFEESVPIEVYIAIGEYVWDVGHSRLVREILYAVAHTAYLVFFIVAYVHLCEIAAYTQPFTVTYDNLYLHSFSYYSQAIGKKSDFVVPNQFSHNLTVSYSIQKGRYNFSFECRNLTNEKLYDNFSLQKAGRAFYGKVRVYFGK